LRHRLNRFHNALPSSVLSTVAAERAAGSHGTLLSFSSLLIVSLLV